jgi:four helix bundle protein
MPTIQRFEDIEAWKSGRKLRHEVYRLTRLKMFSADFALVSQIRRAAISVTSNIAEGFEREGNREFIQFLSQAKGSAGEIQDQLYAALDEGYIS